MTEPSQKNLDDKIRQFIQANEFDNNVISALEHYVYVISDSYDTPLYVGKGVGGRVLHHFKNIIDKEMPDTRTQILRALFEADQNPKVVIARYGIKEASEALIIESVLIDMLIPKLNKVLGHKAGQFGKTGVDWFGKRTCSHACESCRKLWKGFSFSNSKLIERR